MQNCIITTIQNRFCEGRGFAQVTGNVSEMFVFGCVKVCLNVAMKRYINVSHRYWFLPKELQKVLLKNNQVLM